MWDDDYLDDRLGIERDLEAAYAAFHCDYYDDDYDELDDYQDVLNEL